MFKDKLIVWKEGDTWLMGCRRFDILAQGSTLKEAWERFSRAFTIEVLGRIQPDGTFPGLPLLTPEVLANYVSKEVKNEATYPLTIVMSY